MDSKYALCGVPDEDECCVCVRPLGHPLDELEKEYHLGIGFLHLPLPDDIHPSFARDVEGRRALVDLRAARERIQELEKQVSDLNDKK